MHEGGIQNLVMVWGRREKASRGGEGGRWARTSVGSRAPSVGCGETESEGLVGERRVEAVSLTTP